MSEGERRLAAILSADVAGYSRLMGLTRKPRPPRSPKVALYFAKPSPSTARLCRPLP